MEAVRLWRPRLRTHPESPLPHVLSKASERASLESRAGQTDCVCSKKGCRGLWPLDKLLSPAPWPQTRNGLVCSLHPGFVRPSLGLSWMLSTFPFMGPCTPKIDRQTTDRQIEIILYDERNRGWIRCYIFIIIMFSFFLISKKMKIEPFLWVPVSIPDTRLCVLWATWRSRSCVLWLIEHRTPQPKWFRVPATAQQPKNCSG